MFPTGAHLTIIAGPVTLAELLPHLNAALNAVGTTLLVLGLLAIRRGDRQNHPKLVLGAFGAGLLFLVGYVLSFVLSGHQRFPGDDWVRTLFLVILGTHTVLAVTLAPMVLRTIYLAWRKRFAQHRRLARITAPMWLYVSITGLIVYVMINHIRPA